MVMIIPCVKPWKGVLFSRFGALIAILTLFWLTVCILFARNTSPDDSRGEIIFPDSETLEDRSMSNLVRIQRYCDSTLSTESSAHVKFLVDHRHNLMLCPVPGVASTTLKRIIYFSNRNNSRHISSLSSLTKKDLDSLIEPLTYSYKQGGLGDRLRKVVFVRDPYKRLFSVFMDRIYVPSIRTPRVYGSGVNVYSISPCTEGMTFTDAVKYAIDVCKGRKLGDENFRSQQTICQPCNTHFDIVGKLETFADDVGYMFKHSGLLKDHVSYSIFETFPDVFYKNRDKCLSNRYLCHRVWNKFKVYGFLRFNQDFPQGLKEDLTKNECMSLLRVSHGIPSPDSAKKQMKLAYTEAYRTVPMDLLTELRTCYKEDCELFGYDANPREIFDRSTEFVHLGLFENS